MNPIFVLNFKLNISDNVLVFQNGVYQSIEKLAKDLEVLFSNARQYNSDDSKLYKVRLYTKAETLSLYISCLCFVRRPLFWNRKMLVCTLWGGGGGLKMCTVCTFMKMVTFLGWPLKCSLMLCVCSCRIRSDCK